MKKIAKIGILTAIVLVALASCTTATFANMAYGTPSSYESLGTFETTVTGNKWLGSGAGTTYFNIAADAPGNTLQEALQMEIDKLGGNGAINVEIVYGLEFIDYLLNYVSGSIYAPYTITITGEVVNF